MSEQKAKIHLLVSVYLTNELIQAPNYYGINPKTTYSKVDQFLSTVHSISKIEFSSAEVNFDVSADYIQYLGVLSKFIEETIKPDRMNIGRFENFNDWKTASLRIPEDTDMVLLKTNHDHVFIQENQERFQRFIQFLSTNKEFYLGEVTHWPEAIGNFNKGRWRRPKEASLDSVYETTATKTIGTCLVQFEFFKSWWFVDFTSGSRIVRPDNPFGPGVTFPAVTRYIPMQEFFRHLDGYGHVNVNSPHAAPLRPCCILRNNEINHTDWYIHEFVDNLGDGSELPLIFNSEGQKLTNQLVNHVLLASSYRVNVRNVLYILLVRSRNNLLHLSRVLFMICSNKYFLKKVLNLFLPTDYGNYFLFKTKSRIIHKWNSRSIAIKK